MSDPLNQIETIATLSVPRYAPRFKSLPIPGARWDDEPLFCLKVNDEWLSHILGVLGAMDQPDTWLGTPEEIYDARQQVNEIMVAFMEDCDPMSNCCPEPNRTRYTSDGTYEVSYDGGTTWVDGSDFDPRYTSPQYPLIPGDNGDAKKCSAANSVLVQIKDKVAGWEGMLSTATNLVEFGLAAITLLVVGIFAPVAVPFIFGICITIIATCWNAGAEDYSAAFNDSIFDDLLCILFCHVSADGTFNDAAIAAILADCNSHFSPIARDAFRTAFIGWGAIGTTNAATLGGGGEDCDGCDCSTGCDNEFMVLANSPNYYGVLLAQTEQYVIARSDVINAGQYFTILVAPTLTDCCFIQPIAYVLDSWDPETDSPDDFEAMGTPAGVEGSDCGNAIGTGIGPKSDGGCLNLVQNQSFTPFVIKYLKDNCP